LVSFSPALEEGFSVAEVTAAAVSDFCCSGFGGSSFAERNALLASALVGVLLTGRGAVVRL
jgi:hypothetical protein